MVAKTGQLQVRVSADERERIRQRAEDAGMTVSEWVLRRLLPPVEDEFQGLCRELAERPEFRAHALAHLHDFFRRLGGREFSLAVRFPPQAELAPFEANYVAAMVEYAAVLKAAPMPDWTRGVPPLETPWFAAPERSLRLHLLTQSPPPFRRRNLFVDASVGSRA